MTHMLELSEKDFKLVVITALKKKEWINGEIENIRKEIKDIRKTQMEISQLKKYDNQNIHWMRLAEECNWQMK